MAENHVALRVVQAARSAMRGYARLCALRDISHSAADESHEPQYIGQRRESVDEQGEGGEVGCCRDRKRKGGAL